MVSNDFTCCGCCLDEKVPLIANMEEETVEEEKVPVVKNLEEEPEEIEEVVPVIKKMEEPEEVEEESCEVPQVCVGVGVSVGSVLSTAPPPPLPRTTNTPCSVRR